MPRRTPACTPDFVARTRASREARFQILRKSRTDVVTQALCLLSAEDLPPYAPVQENELAVNGDCCADVRLLNAIFEAGEQVGLSGRLPYYRPSIPSLKGAINISP